MTLGRQLFLIIALLFTLVFAGTFLISMENTREYLVAQLESHAQDAATSLGLSLSPHMAEGDRVIMERMVDAIFDSGYYRDLVVEDMHGKPMIERHRQVRLDGIPDWFVNHLVLDTPRADALIMAGWRQGGVVWVRSHPGYAYEELWDDANQTLVWSLASFVVAVVAVYLLLRVILAPLRAVEGQADAISNREFPVLDRLPHTRELRRVVEAMNRMSARVRDMFQEQTRLAEHLRTEAYTDNLTGLANRRSLMMRLEQVTNEGDETARGALMLVNVSGLENVNQERGHQAGDDVLRQVAAVIEAHLGDRSEAFVGRLGGTDFGIWLPDVIQEEAEEIAGNLAGTLGTLRGDGTESVVCHMGVGLYAGREDLSGLLSQADMALRKAQLGGPNAWQVYVGMAPAQVMGAEAWRARILQVLNDRQLVLLYQTVEALPEGAPLQMEALARIRDDAGELVPAGVFLPMAERQGLAADLDRLVLEILFRDAARWPAGGTPLAVNISAGSLKDAAIGDWLEGALSAEPALAGRVVLEVSEYGALANLPVLEQLISRLRPRGVRFSMDQFGAGSSSFGYLQRLKLDYLKIDGGYIRCIQDQKDNQFFVRTLTGIAHSLEIRVVASFVESEAELAIVRALGMDGAQGYLIGRPVPLPEA